MLLFAIVFQIPRQIGMKFDRLIYSFFYKNIINILSILNDKQILEQRFI